MDTTTAAQQAGVTVATIRHWCRMGAIRATKTAGRWTINPTSLAYRINLGKKKAPMDLNATYTTTLHHEGEVTITAQVKTRTTKTGVTIHRIKGLPALMADRLDDIDPDLRAHTVWELRGAAATIATQERPELDTDPGIHTRDGGRIATTYHGTAEISTDDVLDLLEQVRSQLGL